MNTSMEVSVEYSKANLGRVCQGLLSGSKDNKAISVHVKDGLHSGSSVNLGGDPFTIGGSPDDDLMLLDDGLDSGSVHITIHATIMGLLMSVETTRNDVFVNGIAALPDQPHHRLPCTIQLGAVQLHATPYDIRGNRSRIATKNALVGVLAVLAITTFVLITATAPPAINATLSLPATIDTTQTTDAISVAETHDAVLATIAASNLDTYLTFDTTTPGTLRVVGTLPENLMPAWRSFRHTVDTQFRTLTTIANVSSAPQVGNLPAIESVTFGDNPHLTLSNGTTIGVGDTLVDEWEVQHIEVTGFSLKRRGEAVFVEY